MKKHTLFKSIYARFAVIFLGIKWILDSLTFMFVIRLLSNNLLTQFAMKGKVFENFQYLKTVIGLAFLVSTMLGTIIIILAVTGIVRPIKRLSTYSKEVAKGNFDIELKVTSSDEIGQLTSDFNIMTKELRNIDVLRKDFVSNVSHEFKTPITSIKGYAKLIRDGNLTPQQLIEYSEIIVEESERLSQLTSNMLRLSELDSHVIREEAKEFSLDEQIRKMILMLEVEWSKKGITFDIDLADIDYIGNEQLLGQVWINLLQNAIKFSNENGVIRVSLIKMNNAVMFVITDYGKGMKQEDIEHIFERFYKADRSRSKEGNGLGLVIVKNIIELSNGKISVDSEEGKCSTFRVELPM